MSKKEHVVVVGAGIAGLASAYYLNKEGFNVTVVEKSDGRDNCSYGNAGMVVPSHIVPLASPGIIGKGLRWMLKAESPFYIKPRLDKKLLSWGWKFKQASTEQHVEESAPVLRDLLLRNRQLLIDLEEDESLDFGFQKNGLFNLCRTEKGLEEETEVVERARELGIPAEVLSAEEVWKMEPKIEMDIIGATYFPKDAHLHPGLLMDRLKNVLRAKGVEFVFNEEVTGLASDSKQVKGVVTSDGQEIKGSKVVLCPGAWTSTLVSKLDFSLPMQAGKGYSITLQNPKSLPDICALLAEAKVSMTPMQGKLRFGGTMEIVGIDQSITPAKIKALKKSVVQYFPEYSMQDLNGHDVWVGLRPCSPDGLPYVGNINQYKNLFVSTGHAMMGISLSFSSGELISQLITEGQAELSHPLIDPNRYM
ncbi:MAG TPA: FAD-dependent oxidoreductase [Balneolaceae bacterium]|nr:FAD-dependent oxidoreductase [Balneolaceae bacterium]